MEKLNWLLLLIRFSEHYISPLFEMRRHHGYSDAGLIGMEKEASDI